MTARLTTRTLRAGVGALGRRDDDLAMITCRHGPPPLWARPAGFATLVKIVLEQQVSLASAGAAYRRLQERLGRVTPAGFLALDDATLRAAGFSRQKTGYCRELAAAVDGGALSFARLNRMDDPTIRGELMRLKGIGAWTADIYLLMALRRPDVWPTGDLALARAVQEVKRLRRPPSDERLARISRSWRPWRAVAARMLWHHYLCRRRG